MEKINPIHFACICSQAGNSNYIQCTMFKIDIGPDHSYSQFLKIMHQWHVQTRHRYTLVLSYTKTFWNSFFQNEVKTTRHRSIKRMPLPAICLGHTLAPKKPSLQCANADMTSKTVLCTIFGHVVTMTFNSWILPIFSHVVTFEPQISRNPSHCPNKSF